MVFESVKKTGRLLVVHEAVRSFSVSSEILAEVSEKCFEYLKAPLARCTGYDVITPYDRGEGFHQINPQKVAVAIENILDFKF
jgi:pyruvate dehydrogenase E1 component beta subunit